MKITRKSKLARQEMIAGYLFLLPCLLGLVLWIGGPIIASLFLSFTKYEVVTPMNFIGFRHYQNLIRDALFWQSIKVTAYYSLGRVPLIVILGLLIALLLNQRIRGTGIFRTIYYTPAVTSGVAVALLWLWLFNPDFGVLNTILAKIGLPRLPWIYSQEWVIPSFIVMSVWGVGANMLLYLGALQSVPSQLYESATLDGASSLHRFWHITIPMISPIILFNLVMTTISSFQIFTSSFIMTQGGPANASLFYVLYLYRNGFQYFKMGYASALAWILFLIVFVFTLLIFKSTPFWVYYEGETRKG